MALAGETRTRGTTRMRRAAVAFLGLALTAVVGSLFVRASLGSDLVRSTLEQQLATRLGQPVRIRSAGASLFPRITIDLSDVSIGSPDVIRLGTVHIGVGLRDLASRTITDADVVVTDGRVTLPLPFPLVATASDSPTHQTVGMKVESVRTISLRGVALTRGQQTLRIDLESALVGDRLDVHELTARADRTQVRATGTVNSLAKLDAQFEAEANPLDLDELIALGSAFTATSGPARTEPTMTVPLHVAVKLTAPSGQFASYSFTQLTTTLDMTPTHLRLSPLTVTTFGGSYKGRLDVDTLGDTPHMRLVGQLDRLDVAELLKASGSPGGITGALSGSVSLNGGGFDTETLMRSSSGAIEAAVSNGSIPHLEMVRTIVLAFGKPSGAPPAGSGSAFSRLGGTFALDRGVLTSNDLAMTSRDFDLAGSGSLKIATAAVDVGADVVLSEELTAQAGTDLRRYAQQAGRVVVPARISGTLQQPVVTLDIAAATRRAIGNELKRRATSFLEGLFKKKRD